ncbi:MAG: hypothetical protein WAW13_00140 [Minisyncoccia bacterium]
MEGIQKSTESVEKSRDWRVLIKESPAKAETLIAAIDGFGDMEYSEKITALTALIDTLLEDNDNRYTAREIARQQEILKANMLYERRMAELGVNA